MCLFVCQARINLLVDYSLFYVLAQDFSVEIQRSVNCHYDINFFNFLELEGGTFNICDILNVAIKVYWECSTYQVFYVLFAGEELISGLDFQNTVILENQANDVSPL